jgi:N-acetyl-anhydromuramyl-L-alanine amidase AmpD
MSRVISSSTPLAEAGGVKIDTSLLSTHNCNVMSSRAVAFIVLHYTGNKGPDTAKANASYFRTTDVQASAHFTVDDSNIYQCIALKDVAWHVGAKLYYNECRNATSIGVEMCCTAGNYRVGAATIENAAQLTAVLFRLIGVSGSAVDTFVVRHWDVTRKECPAQMTGKGNAEWTMFLARVKAILDGKEDTVVSKTLIAGAAQATAEQMTAYIKSVNSKVPQSVIDMIPLYLSEGRAEGIKGDLAFAQSCLETGNFTFKGSAVTLDQNNFCGMAVTSNGMKGSSFPTPQMGIRAQVQHLKAYANKEALVNACVDPRFKYVTRGCIPYVEILGIQENPNRQGWSSGVNYGGQILDILGRILKVSTGSAGTATTPAKEASTTSSTLLRMGSRGDAVKLLQHRLNLVGYSLDEDGIWGTKTDNTVRVYQKKAGLEVDGVVGPLTQEKLIQDAILTRAQELAAYLVKNKWHYKGNGYTAKATFEATKKLNKPGSSCAHFVSWVLQDVGLLQTNKVLSHSKAGYGTGAKALVNADKLIDCVILYPNLKIASYKAKLQPGDVLVHDSSIGIWTGKVMLTGRDGRTVDSKNRYTTLTITSGYEWNHPVLAVVRAKV